MKKIFFQITCCLFLASCSQLSKYNGPVIAPESIVKNMMSWLYYQRDYIVWSADYVALDADLKVITKTEFLTLLIKGDYLPLKINTRDSSLCYQLYRLNDTVDREIIASIRDKAKIEYQYFKMEGQQLPKFNFIDLEGNVYNPETTKGKTLVLNSWFIHCTSCVAEMPKLNELVKQFADRKDILFIGLAFDPAKNLKQFLMQTTFKYKVVPDMENYLINDLKINGFPTHLIINSQGVILKVIDNNINEISSFLNKQKE